MKKATVDGWELAYEEAGSGEPVFLLHGLLADRSMWAEQIAALRDRYRCITVDAPGHGDSPGRPPGFTLEDEAEALVGLAGALGIPGPAIWIGHSMGAMKAMRIALAHPERVRALALIDTQPFPENPDAKAQYDAMIEVTKAQGPSEDLAQVTGQIMFGAPFLATPEGERWVKHYANLDAHAFEGSARSVFDRGDISERIGTITAPTLVVHGVDDTPIPVEIARDYVTRIPGARLVEIPGSGHHPPMEKPAETTAALTAFLAGLA